MSDRLREEFHKFRCLMHYVKSPSELTLENIVNSFNHGRTGDKVHHVADSEVGLNPSLDDV